MPKKHNLYLCAHLFLSNSILLHAITFLSPLFCYSFPDSSNRKEKFALLSARFNQNWKLLPDIKLTESVQLASRCIFQSSTLTLFVILHLIRVFPLIIFLNVGWAVIINHYPFSSQLLFLVERNFSLVIYINNDRGRFIGNLTFVINFSKSHINLNWSGKFF